MSGPFGDGWLSYDEAVAVVGSYRLHMAGLTRRKSSDKRRVYYNADEVYSIAEKSELLPSEEIARRLEERREREQAKRRERIERLWRELVQAVGRRERYHAEKALGWVFPSWEVAARHRVEASTIPVMAGLGARLKERDFELYSGLPYGLILEARKLGVIPDISLKSVGLLRERAEALFKAGGL